MEHKQSINKLRSTQRAMKRQMLNMPIRGRKRNEWTREITKMKGNSGVEMEPRWPRTDTRMKDRPLKS